MLDRLIKAIQNKYFFYGFMLLSSAFLVFNYNYVVGVNFSESLPFKFYVIGKNQTGDIKKGDLIAFKYAGNDFFPKGEVMVKYVAGEGFDRVDVIGVDYYIIDKDEKAPTLHVGASKLFSGYKQEKDPLTPLKPQTIPPGKYFVYSPYPHSFDSRYEHLGLVDGKDIVGKVIFTFGSGNYKAMENGEVKEVEPSDFYAKKS
jgi:type IV secretory pathway protease TraF